jgi:hypothetical protein
MRTALLALLLVGCVPRDSYPPDPGPYYPPQGGGGGGGGGPYGCTSDTQCATGEVCARDSECLPAGDVYAVHVTWTLQGQTASATTCSSSPDLELDFTSTTAGWWGYAPVPCMEGKFSIDKLPTWYTTVQLGLDGNTASGTTGTIDKQTGLVNLDLPY